jgi:hypothetical protein
MEEEVSLSTTGSRGKSGLTEDVIDYQTKILENVIEDCLSSFRNELRDDIRNMHLEILRQFQIQKVICV